MPAARQKIEHPIPPTYDENSTILILGSFPSVKTRTARMSPKAKRNGGRFCCATASRPGT